MGLKISRALYRKEIGLIRFIYLEEVELYKLLIYSTLYKIEYSDIEKQIEELKKSGIIIKKSPFNRAKLHKINDKINDYGLNIMILLLSKLSNVMNKKIFSRYTKEKYPYGNMSRSNEYIDEDIDLVIRNAYIKLQSYIKYKIENKILFNQILNIPLSTSNLILNIGGQKYELIAKTDNNENDRILLLIKCNDTFVLYYRSNSEMNIWRLASIEKSRDPFFKTETEKLFKGQDYITETFINIKLQKYINDNYENIPYSYIHKIEKFESKREFNVPLYTDLSTQLNIKPNYKKYEYFEILKDVKCGSIINKSFINKIRLTEVQSRKNYYTRKLYEITQRSDNLRPIKKNYIKLYYKILNEYLSLIVMNFTNTNIPTFEYAYTFNIDESIFIINIYSILITIGLDNFIFYVSKYKFIKNNITIGIFTSIINIIPLDTTNKYYLLESGQYRDIISCGNYICKIIEYSDDQTDVIGSDSDTDDSDNEDKTNNNCSHLKEDQIYINNIYRFIGHCSHNIYPLNLINFPDIIIPANKKNVSKLYYPDGL